MLSLKEELKGQNKIQQMKIIKRVINPLRHKAEEQDKLSYSFNRDKLGDYLEVLKKKNYKIHWDDAINSGLYKGKKVEEEEEEEPSDPTLRDRERTPEEWKAESMNNSDSKQLSFL